MGNPQKTQLRFDDWPQTDRQKWKAAFKSNEFLEEEGAGAHLSPATRAALKGAYGRFLGFLSRHGAERLDRPPAGRIDHVIVAKYVEQMWESCLASTIANELHHVRLALSAICPGADLGWLQIITKRIAAQAKRRPERHHLITSERLYALGQELMDRAVAEVDGASVAKATAFDYRDGLIIALLATIPLRRRTLASLRIGKHLVKSGSLWALEITAADTKSRRQLDYSIAPELSARIDVYLAKFRAHVPGAGMHDALWVSNKGAAMTAGAIYDAVRRRTQEAFGFAVNLHRFRHAAATFWSMQDPKNVRGMKDLLGQASFRTTEKHYIIAQSRMAGRVLARIVDGN
ncbi:MAG TPA: site-specific integrase [Trichormus sp.]|jgi:integrase